MTRRADLDAAKGIGMLLVIVGHSTPPEALQVWIYGFHMPLFFVISGLLWRGEVALAHSARALLVPFFIASIASWGLWLAKQQLHRPDPVPWWGPLLATAYGGDINGYLVHNTPLWFLPAMFSLLLGLWLARQWLSSAATIAVMALLGLLVVFWPTGPATFTWPLSASQGWVGGVFFAAGFIWQRKPAAPSRQQLWWVLAAMLAYSVLAHLNGRVDLFSLHLQNPALYLTCGLLGAGFTIVACRWHWVQRPWLLRLGRHSLLILAIHLPILWILRAVTPLVHVPATWPILAAVCTGTVLLLSVGLERRGAARPPAAQDIGP